MATVILPLIKESFLDDARRIVLLYRNRIYSGEGDRMELPEVDKLFMALCKPPKKAVGDSSAKLLVYMDEASAVLLTNICLTPGIAEKAFEVYAIKPNVTTDYLVRITTQLAKTKPKYRKWLAAEKEARARIKAREEMARE